MFVRRVQGTIAQHDLKYIIVNVSQNVLTGIGAAALVLLLTAGCERRDGARAPSGETNEHRPTQITHDPHVVLHEGRRQRAVLQAQRMAQYETPDSSYAVLRPPRGDTTRVHVQLFTPEGDSSATITADSLLYFSDEGRADAYGNVVVRTPEQRQLYSEHVVWRQGDRKVRSSRFVRIITPTETLNGQGLVADEDLSSYQIGQFDAEVDLDDESDDT